MNIAIIVSVNDIAGMNIKESLIRLFDFKETGRYDNNPVFQLNNIKLYTINKDTVNADNIDKELGADIFIFATRHSAKAGIKTLSIHTPGNWDDADLGGISRKLCIAVPSYVKKGFLALKRLNDLEDFEITLEATHHGPYIDKPCFFIEIGSAKPEWENRKAADIIAGTIIEIINSEHENYVPVLGIGGTHYADNFNKILSKTELSIGHICPKYMLEMLTKDMIRQAMDRSAEKIQYVLLDWKGLGPEKQRIIDMLDDMKIHHKRTKDFLK